ncbi:hypothetical protein ADEAN_000553000 [Angomonas deanei]|uniref:Uncharacterized protein n=1 Tax=Angomonas deanei TaxID=59799 RepID=A0A7G2CGP3_9TRYP|nr:hypothetical protein ADEAN_000553000 [Angomonas deanei]
MLGSLAILSRVVTYPISNIIKSAAAILGDNDMVLFTLYYESGALTTELFSDMLGIPRTPAMDNKPSGKKSKKKQVPTPAHNGGAVVANKLTPALLSTVLKWNLSSECQAVLLRCIGDTDRFLALVGSDGTLAAEVLNIYAPALTPSLKLVSLVPALNDYLLDFFIDLAQMNAGGQVAALHEVTFVDVALSQWDEARLACICKEMEVRCPAPSRRYGQHHG